ncbi:1-acyl-sn-glycerol-3-phosphate acyltransferase : 1-acyl-sn-glycerol-3-phosphate acyltransferase OS=uncultured planctomycete GN=HGMM_F09D09C25 PE=4 SV=1: Acyltransferase [Gemmataceae bacterium]|nr:1-acyl-sn-glycerol-3-phosphate acyltransferase : 1-acyl-sn-glycerol-3-phosphate acyltransferase OS=uncultured planctomycete GN=HGMM_F09D09C25 PE=4 SV=1: Acyltransferase [Gemmataceae bacterium]VTT97118.1 1-acyl-sn-glycerol-3-phosphate acyltransferase : 1-acyl-sn-glycerol-3-phosphate acyltransferase OS=uncultured planctomycete GN=HGMM_F09D09C25 PE=4 SV=1: Acyltransferase [Gemmataceae bacterium]
MHDRPGLIGRMWYDAAYWASWGGFTFGFSYRGTGRWNVPKRGPALVVANHQSMFDPMLVGLSCPRYLTFLARNTLFDVPLLGPLIRSLGSVPIDRGMAKDGIRAVLDRLSHGRAVLVFPEGERTFSGDLQPLKPGIALLVQRLNCPVVPVGIAGAFDAWNRHTTIPRPSPLFLPPGASTIGVSVGEPIPASRYKELGRDAMLADLHAEIARQVAKAEALRRR